MAHKGIILGRKKDKLFPEDFIKKVTDQYNTCTAFCYAENGVIQFISENGVPDWEGEGGLKDSIETYNQNSLLYFGQNTSDYLEDDLQPFVLLETNNNARLVAFTEGEFLGFAKQGSTHSNDYHMIADFLQDEIDTQYDKCGQNLDKLMQVLDSPECRKHILNTIIPKGTIVLFAGTGEYIVYKKNDKFLGGKETDWWATDSLGYAPAEPAKPAEEKRELTMREKIELRKKGKPLSIPGDPPGTSVPTITPPKTDTAVGLLPEKEQMFHPPENLSGRDLKKWYGRNRVGGKPTGWENKPPIPLTELKMDSPLRERIKDGGKPILKVGDPPPATEKKDVPPLLFPQQKKFLTEQFLPNSVKMLSLDGLKAVESEYETFTEQLDYDLGSMLLWDPDTVRKLGNVDSRALSISWLELRKMLFQANPQLLKQLEAAMQHDDGAAAEGEEKEEKELTMREKIALRKKNKVAM